MTLSFKNFFRSKAGHGPFKAPRSMHASVLIELFNNGLAERRDGFVVPLEGIVVAKGFRRRDWLKLHNTRSEGRTPEDPANQPILLQVQSDDASRRTEITERLNRIFAKWPAVSIMPPQAAVARTPSAESLSKLR